MTDHLFSIFGVAPVEGAKALFVLCAMAACAISFVCAVCLTPLFRNLAVKLRLLDHPDLERKSHAHPVPRIGGVPVVLACVITFFLMAYYSRHGYFQLGLALPLVMALLPAATVVFVVGLVDDLRGLRARLKLVGLLVAAALACASGVLVTHLGGIVLPIWASYAITVVWLLACSNAFNLIDGLDGLASGLGLIAIMAILPVSFFTGNHGLHMVVAPLAGALLGFLMYNRRPASVFLGDSGSLTLGFLLGCFGVLWSGSRETVFQASAPLIALSIPLLDTTLAIGRRFVRGLPIFGADRRHIHHRLLDLGFSQSQAVMALYCAAAAAAALSVLQSELTVKAVGIVVLVVAVAALVLGARALRYVEFSSAARVSRLHYLQRLINVQCHLAQLGNNLRTSHRAEDGWRMICAVARELGFQSGHLHFEGADFVFGDLTPDAQPCTMTIPLREQGYLQLSHALDSPVEPVLISTLAKVVSDSFPYAQLAAENAFEDSDPVGPIQPTKRLHRAMAH